MYVGRLDEVSEGLLLSFGSLYAQNIRTYKSDRTCTIELASLDDIKSIQWGKIKRFCKKFDTNEMITMKIVLDDSKRKSKNSINVSGFKTEFDGKAGEIKEVIQEAKKFMKELKKAKRNKDFELDF